MKKLEIYLDNRQKLGFNVIQSVVYWYPHGGGIENGPLNAANAYGHRPFVGDEDAPNTSKPLLVKGGSPDSPNDYWDHVDYIIEAVRKRDMYLALLPCWGRAYITLQMDNSQQEFTEEEARAYGTFLGKRYKQEPHILWVLGGDAKAQIKAITRTINSRNGINDLYSGRWLRGLQASNRSAACLGRRSPGLGPGFYDLSSRW